MDVVAKKVNNHQEIMLVMVGNARNKKMDDGGSAGCLPSCRKLLEPSHELAALLQRVSYSGGGALSLL